MSTTTVNSPGCGNPMSDLFVVNDEKPTLAEKVLLGAIVWALTAVVLYSVLYVTVLNVAGPDGARGVYIDAAGKAPGSVDALR